MKLSPRMVLVALSAVAVVLAAVVIVLALRPASAPPAAAPSPTALAGAVPPGSAAASSASSLPPPTAVPVSRDCGLPAIPPPPVELPRPAANSVLRINADAVSKAVVVASRSVDTVVDCGWSDALRRAVALLTPQFGAGVNNPPPAKPDAVWREWASHQAYTVVTVTASPEDLPIDTMDTAYRSWVVTSTPTGRDGWTGLPQQTIEMITLHREVGGWAVSQIDSRQ